MVVWRISHQLSLRMIPSCYGHGDGENAHAPPSHEKLRGGLLFWSGATEKDTDTSGDGQHGDKDEIISPSEARHQFLGSSNDRHFKPACSPTTYKLTTRHIISFAAINHNQTLKCPRAAREQHVSSTLTYLPTAPTESPVNTISTNTVSNLLLLLSSSNPVVPEDVSSIGCWLGGLMTSAALGYAAWWWG